MQFIGEESFEGFGAIHFAAGPEIARLRQPQAASLKSLTGDEMIDWDLILRGNKHGVLGLMAGARGFLFPLNRNLSISHSKDIRLDAFLTMEKGK